MNLFYIKSGVKEKIIKTSNVLENYGEVFEDCHLRTYNLISELITDTAYTLILKEEFFIFDKDFFKEILDQIFSKKESAKIIQNGIIIAILFPSRIIFEEKQKNSSLKVTFTEKECKDIFNEFSERKDFHEYHINEETVFLIDSVEKICVANSLMNKERVKSLLKKGVFIENIDTVKISSSSVVEEGAVLGSNIIIKSNSRIKKDVLIGAGSEIINSVIGCDSKIQQGSRIDSSIIGEKVEVLSSTIFESKIDNGSKIGPNAYLRPGSVIGKNVKIGDFVEIKNSVIGDNTKVSHLTYIGDADIGCGVNVGCGTVFVNYDGKSKHRSTVSDNVFIGCNVNLVSPVFIGEGSFIAAGSTITEDVGESQLAIARSRQTNKDGWMLKK